MNPFQENENLNALILSQILTEDIYIIPEAGIIPSVKTDQKKDKKDKAVIENEVFNPKTILENKESKESKPPLTKDIIVLLDKPATKEELEFLSKILGALKLTLEDVSLMPKAEFRKDLNFKKLISFNVSMNALLPDLKTEKYILKDVNASKILLADGLQELTMDVKKKKQLWDTLQVMFGLK